MNNSQIVIADILRSLGMHPKYKGYTYILFILQLTQLHPTYIYSMNEILYKTTAQEFGVSVVSVERNIRFVIKRTWEFGNAAELMRLFDVYDAKYAPTNGEFIAVLTECLISERFSVPVQMMLSY